MYRNYFLVDVCLRVIFFFLFVVVYLMEVVSWVLWGFCLFFSRGKVERGFDVVDDFAF